MSNIFHSISKFWLSLGSMFAKIKSQVKEYLMNTILYKFLRTHVFIPLNNLVGNSTYKKQIMINVGAFIPFLQSQGITYIVIILFYFVFNNLHLFGGFSPLATFIIPLTISWTLFFIWSHKHYTLIKALQERINTRKFLTSWLFIFICVGVYVIANYFIHTNPSSYPSILCPYIYIQNYKWALISCKNFLQICLFNYTIFICAGLIAIYSMYHLTHVIRIHIFKQEPTHHRKIIGKVISSSTYFKVMVIINAFILIWTALVTIHLIKSGYFTYHEWPLLKKVVYGPITNYTWIYIIGILSILITEGILFYYYLHYTYQLVEISLKISNNINNTKIIYNEFLNSFNQEIRFSQKYLISGLNSFFENHIINIGIYIYHTGRLIIIIIILTYIFIIEYSVQMVIYLLVSILSKFINPIRLMVTNLVTKFIPTSLAFGTALIEFISNWVVPVSLGFRVAANLFAGQTIISILGNAVGQLQNTNSVYLPLIWLVLIMAEIIIPFIQAGIFIRLVSTFKNSNAKI